MGEKFLFRFKMPARSFAAQYIANVGNIIDSCNIGRGSRPVSTRPKIPKIFLRFLAVDAKKSKFAR